MCQKLPYENPRIDKCLLEEIANLNANGYKTLASCCGHDKYPKTIIGFDIHGILKELCSGLVLEKKKRNRYYKRDKQGYYYLYCMNPIEN